LIAAHSSGSASVPLASKKRNAIETLAFSSSGSRVIRRIAAEKAIVLRRALCFLNVSRFQEDDRGLRDGVSSKILKTEYMSHAEWNGPRMSAATAWPLELPRNSRVLVTGGTGFTGAALLRNLAKQSVSIRAITRRLANADPLKDLTIEWIQGQVYDPAVVTAAARDVDFIFHAAAAYREAGLSEVEYRNVHVVSTRLLAEAAAANPNFKRLIHVSTVGVHGHIEHPPADENYPFHPGDVYQRTKAEAELWLRDFSRQSGLPHTVIRPCAIYGPGDRRLLKVFKMAAQPVFILLGRGPCLYHLIHVEDLARMMIGAANHPAAAHEVFIGGDPEAITIEKMGRIIASELGRPLRVVRLPAWPFFLAADVCEAICRPLKLEPPIYRRRVAFFTKDRSFDTRKVRETLGYEYLYETEAGLRETTRWYVAQGWLRP
jgi:dihydroflavonol-4-reductase